MEKIRNIVDNELSSVEELLYKSLGNIDNSISEEINAFLKSPSKRIRSILTLLYFMAQGALPSRDFYMVLASGELFHNASLLHDDVIDDAKIRRNSTTISEKFSSKISILAGDLLISRAIKLLSELNNTEIIRLFLKCAEDMSNAEIQQFLSRGKNVDFDLYKNICKGKTGALFGTILESAAIVSGIDCTNAREFGEKFGIIFQIKNDIQTESRTNDVKNGIRTAEDIIGIEKTCSLIDNYKEEIRSKISDFPNNKYKKGLEDLITII